MYGGRGAPPANGANSTFSTLENTTWMLVCGNGVMLSAQPCMVFASNTSTEPSAPVNRSMPYAAPSDCRCSLPGTPPEPSEVGTNVRWLPGIAISSPVSSCCPDNGIETLTARGAGMPSSACQVSNGECQ